MSSFYRRTGRAAYRHPALSASILGGAELLKIIFLNRFFYPDHSATSQMLSDLAFALAGRGHKFK